MYVVMSKTQSHFLWPGFTRRDQPFDLRTPPMRWRQWFVGSLLALPGTVGGLMLALALPLEFAPALALTGTLVGLELVSRWRMIDMLTQLRTAFVLLIAMTLLTGVAYPLVVTAIAQIAFKQQASGSLLVEGDRAVGSALIGQEFTRPGFFWGRLSATGPVPYNAAASSGSNLGPMNPARTAAAETRIEALKSAGSPAENVPIDLVTASASGLDPHISPAAAELQVARVAKARKLTEEQIRQLVREHTEPRQFGVLGEPRVNVLLLNLAVQRASMP